MWDTTSVPDGTYVLKVAASDAPSNSPGTALIGELESVSFDIDNTPPRIEMQPAARRRAHGRCFVVRDEQSSVQRVEYSLDASRWRDGLSEGRHRRIRGGKSSRCRWRRARPAAACIIRATDAMNNVATAVDVTGSRKAERQRETDVDASASVATSATT